MWKSKKHIAGIKQFIKTNGFIEVTKVIRDMSIVALVIAQAVVQVVALFKY